MKTLYQKVLERDEIADLDEAARRLALRTLVLDNGGSFRDLQAIINAVEGLGPVADLLADPATTDILINGPKEIWVEREGALALTTAHFEDGEELFAFIERVLATAGRRADLSRPIGDACLPDGTRVHVVIPPVAPGGPVVSIRRFPSEGLTLEDLVDRGMMPASDARLLAGAVTERRSIAVGGLTGSGKTTLLRALLRLAPVEERIILLEETPEIGPVSVGCVSLVTRDNNIEGTGAVDLTELVRASLRMRPDRIVVGEVRGMEALPALSAFSTGHRGSMVTVHAGSPGEVVDRLTMLALMHPAAPGEQFLRRQIKASFDLIVQLGRRGGTRVVEDIVPADGL